MAPQAEPVLVRGPHHAGPPRIRAHHRAWSATDRTGFAKRIWRLRDEPLARRRPPIAARRDAAATRPPPVGLGTPPVAPGPGARRGLVRPRQSRLATPLREHGTGPESGPGHVEGGEGLPAEPQPLWATVPRDIAPNLSEKNAPDWLLPALLKPARKLVLDLISDWPGFLLSTFGC